MVYHDMLPPPALFETPRSAKNDLAGKQLATATWNLEIPVRLKSAQSFSRFRMLLSECEGKAFLISSMRILRGRSLLFQKRR